MKFLLFETKEQRDKRQEENHRRAERDNWRTQNRISKIGAFLAFIAAFGAVASAALAWGAYRQTVKSVKEAKRQADAAWNAADAARRQADAATMPYVFGTFQNARSIHGWIARGDLPGYGSSMDVGLKTENYGAGPAILTGVECLSAWSKRDKIDFRLVDDRRFNTSVGNFVNRDVLSKEPKTFRCLNSWPEMGWVVGYQPSWTTSQINDALNTTPRGYAIWFLARISFEDINGSQHESDICARYEDLGGARQEDVRGFQVFHAPECEDRYNGP